MAFDLGLDFRGTAPYVTDPAYAAVVLGESYPKTYTNGNGQSLNGGWEDAVSGIANRSSALDPRLAGINFVANPGLGGKRFRLDLNSGSNPGTGPYTVDLANGDPATAETVWRIDVEDTDATAILFTVSSTISGTLATSQWVDATGVIRTNAADWVANHATVTSTWATAICRLRIGAVNSGDFTTLAHFRLTSAATASGPLASSLMLLGVGM